MTKHKAVQVLLHPRAASLVEAVYAAHGLHATSDWMLVAIYTGLFVIALAHLIWAHMEVS